MLGVPHDSDPHFSPEGDRLVFRSDAELGFDNIWIMPWSGCETMALRRTGLEANSRDSLSDELVHALALKEEEDYMLASGIRETAERKVRRLLREGRSHAQRVTNETFRWVSDARFHPSGTKVIATKWYFSGRSLGAGEGWEYEVPSLDELKSSRVKSVAAGDGIRRVERMLPPGWSAQMYGNQQVGPEQLLWNGDDTIVYSKNIVQESEGVFQYSLGMYELQRVIIAH